MLNYECNLLGLICFYFIINNNNTIIIISYTVCILIYHHTYNYTMSTSVYSTILYYYNKLYQSHSVFISCELTQAPNLAFFNVIILLYLFS